jgi:hypothetical protein
MGEVGTERLASISERTGPIIRGGHCMKAAGRLPERDGAAYGPRLGGRGDECFVARLERDEIRLGP